MGTEIKVKVQSVPFPLVHAGKANSANLTLPGVSASSAAGWGKGGWLVGGATRKPSFPSHWTPQARMV